MFWEMVGILAAVLISIGYIPQIIKGFRTKKLDDLSLQFLLIIGAGIFLWLLYGLHIQDRILIGANMVGLSENVIIILMKIHYSGKN